MSLVIRTSLREGWRAGAPEDWAALASIHAAAFDGASAAPWSAGALAATAADAALFTAVGREGDPPLGFAIARAAADEAELLTLAVAPAAQRRGAGATLARAVRRWAAARGARTLFLEVARDAAPARRLYAALGFDQVGVRPRYHRRADGGREDALSLRLILPGRRSSSTD